jgi:hypothetical protein
MVLGVIDANGKAEDCHVVIQIDRRELGAKMLLRDDVLRDPIEVVL